MKKINQQHSQNMISDIFIVSRLPVILIIVFVGVISLILQNIYHPLLVQSIIFTLLIIVHMLVYWFSNTLTQYSKWLYIVVQYSIIHLSVFILPEGAFAFFIGSLPILLVQFIPLFQNTLKITALFSGLFIIYLILTIINKGPNALPVYFAVTFFLLIMVIFYSATYNRQVDARIRMEYYLNKLQSAYQKVEYLTLVNERQRMARDLHDTLAQGLAGLIMQLEAMDAHLKKGNTPRAQEIVQSSMVHARETLRNARKAIDDLRENGYIENFHQAVLNIIEQFEHTRFIKVDHDIDPVPALSNFVMENSLYILSECLENITKHAEATRTKIKIKKIDDALLMEITDNGKGFKTKNIGKQLGKYGLLGLKERSQLIGADLLINSTPGSGTIVTVTIPL
ncbi:NarL family two-component system sensor histidine kinase YdfH [Pullulanibacillus pueri]|uniref:histidine kinase n=1 Tax=Pullulanibacillus pueri TaxID=1437324 RepID=A0A8J2ZWT5_9BACL|nr:sensor histidine kinase [Pullulanibacillus pueri]MBM7682812.1 NarL family two-component system sensor histidine kinase YdfH [Pullulanibacillus pueri]GGH83282.1 histidine kinase [Pullulanibacillus pueri]